MKQNGWVFISHSHQDIENVRRIRNKLESLGFEPLLFYLKCLSDKDEIEELIKREIREREWFIYADSKNARNSEWVRTEREYIETLSGKKVFTVDLSAEPQEQMAAIEHMARQMKVFIAASRRDRPLTEALKEALLSHDMQIITDEDITVGASWINSVRNEIGEASRDGFVLLVISQNSENSETVVREAEMALASGGKIVPILVGGAHMPYPLLDKLGSAFAVSLSDSPTKDELARVVAAIEARVSYYESDYTESQGFRYAKRITLPPISRIDADTFALCEELREVTVPESVIYIEATAFESLGDILVHCYPDSYAERFCKIHQIRYDLIGETV